MIDWAHIAGFFWGERAQADWEALTQLATSGDLKARWLVSQGFPIDYNGHQRRAFGEHAAHRIDNLGRALAGAGMLATVEQRAINATRDEAHRIVQRHCREKHS